MWEFYWPAIIVCTKGDIEFTRFNTLHYQIEMQDIIQLSDFQKSSCWLTVLSKCRIMEGNVNISDFQGIIFSSS